MDDIRRQAGQLVMRATPFANESLLGIYSLSNAETRRYVQGVTSVVRELEIR